MWMCSWFDQCRWYNVLFFDILLPYWVIIKAVLALQEGKPVEPYHIVIPLKNSTHENMWVFQNITFCGLPSLCVTGHDTRLQPRLYEQRKRERINGKTKETDDHDGQHERPRYRFSNNANFSCSQTGFSCSELDHPNGAKLFSKQPGRSARVARGSGMTHNNIHLTTVYSFYNPILVMLISQSVRNCVCIFVYKSYIIYDYRHSSYKHWGKLLHTVGRAIQE